MEIPKKVIKAAGELVSMFGQHFRLLGEYRGAQAYLFELPDDEENGFPFVFLDPPGEPVQEVNGQDALDLLKSFGSGIE